MKNYINVFNIGCLMCIASYFLPWLKYDESTSWSGYNIADVTQYFRDGKDFKFIFSLVHVVFIGAIISLLLISFGKDKQARWIGLIVSITGLLSYMIIKLGLNGKSFLIGFTLGVIGLGILLLQTFIPFFRKPLIAGKN
jgi:hypothetical protein